jgi:hypothetical protein
VGVILSLIVIGSFTAADCGPSAAGPPSARSASPGPPSAVCRLPSADGSVLAQTSREQLIEALRSPDANARREALQQLDRAGLPEAAGAVAALAADPDDDIQLMALDTLLNLLLNEHTKGDDGPRRAFERGAEPARPVPASAYEPVATAMTDATAEVRLGASYAFGVLAMSKQGLVPQAAMGRAAQTLEEMLKDPAADVRLTAIAVSGRIFRASQAGPPPVPSALPEPLIEGLIASMNQPDPSEQAAAMEALGRAREARALDALTERLFYHRQNGPPELAVAALDALARLAHPSSVEMVRMLATDPWARNGDPYLAVLFARERLLKDGSSATLRLVLSDRRLGDRARAYLVELGRAP